ncbi:MAG: DsrE family protein [Rhodospirillales bacterium]|nr:DsrE family protein [Rhodospirillales bacterium]
MRKFGIIAASFAALMMLIGATNTADAKNGYGKQKVVYHINYPGGKDDKAYKGALRNIQNHINAVGKENLDLKVVVHGNGIFMMTSAKKAGKLQSAVASLKSQDVNFSVCANTLKGKKLGQDALYEVFDQDIVPSGVAELSKLQQQGYTYIKP